MLESFNLLKIQHYYNTMLPEHVSGAENGAEWAENDGAERGAGIERGAG